MNDGESFLARVESKQRQLRSSELKVVSCISSDPEAAARLSITELAQRSGTSETTVNHLSRSLGFSGFTEMKLAVLRDVFSGGIRNIPSDIVETDSTATVAAKLTTWLTSAIEGTARHIDFGEVERAVDALMRAGRVYFFGIGGSGHVASVAQHLFLKAGLAGTTHSDGYMQVVTAALVGRGDAVLGISHSGQTRDVITALRLANERGATTIAITGNPSAPLLQHADIKLITVSHEEPIYGDFMEAKVSQLFVVDLLYVALLFRDIPTFKQRLSTTAQAIWDRSL